MELAYGVSWGRVKKRRLAAALVAAQLGLGALLVPVAAATDLPAGAPTGSPTSAIPRSGGTQNGFTWTGGIRPGGTGTGFTWV